MEAVALPVGALAALVAVPLGVRRVAVEGPLGTAPWLLVRIRTAPGLVPLAGPLLMSVTGPLLVSGVGTGPLLMPVPLLMT
ncbi:hypothetical protein SAMN05421874_13912 [Nonomuraea maritima]|uniref:Uncharacterized protein n=1 Tax=Nonomuraea maritima TaxID=683260 RepID=A0A1G9QK64_9ACTN|nr:hypothetical protein SAMN05421874_13912 [Nonomuraea maritima]